MPVLACMCVYVRPREKLVADLVALLFNPFLSYWPELDVARLEPLEPVCLCFLFPEEEATVVLSL